VWLMLDEAGVGRLKNGWGVEGVSQSFIRWVEDGGLMGCLPWWECGWRTRGRSGRVTETLLFG
jgi:hypothetical protein